MIPWLRAGTPAGEILRGMGSALLWCVPGVAFGSAIAMPGGGATVDVALFAALVSIAGRGAAAQSAALAVAAMVGSTLGGLPPGQLVAALAVGFLASFGESARAEIWGAGHAIAVARFVPAYVGMMWMFQWVGSMPSGPIAAPAAVAALAVVMICLSREVYLSAQAASRGGPRSMTPGRRRALAGIREVGAQG
jgi:hypothetical protein